MKDNVVRFRCSEEEKHHIEMLAEADPYAENVSEYIMELVKRDAENFRTAKAIGIVRGRKKGTDEVIEKKRVDLGEILIDEAGRISTKTYARLVSAFKEDCGTLLNQPNHRLELYADGRRIKTPNTMADFTTIE